MNLSLSIKRKTVLFFLYTSSFFTTVDPTEETVVVVGGKYLDLMDKVMDTVDQIRWETKGSHQSRKDEK